MFPLNLFQKRPQEYTAPARPLAHLLTNRQLSFNDLTPAEVDLLIENIDQLTPGQLRQYRLNKADNDLLTAEAKRASTTSAVWKGRVLKVVKVGGIFFGLSGLGFLWATATPFLSIPTALWMTFSGLFHSAASHAQFKQERVKELGDFIVSRKDAQLTIGLKLSELEEAAGQRGQQALTQANINLQNANTQNVRLQADLGRANTRRKVAESHYHTACEDLMDVRAEKAQLQARLRETDQESRNLAEEVAHLRRALTSKSQALLGAISHIERVSGDVEALGTQLYTSEAQRNRLLEQLQNTNAQLAGARAEAARRGREAREAIAQVSEAERAMAALREEYADTISQLQNEVARLEEQLRAEREAGALKEIGMQADLDVTKAFLKSTNQLLIDTERELVSLRAKKSQLAERLRCMVTEMEGLNERVAEKGRRVQELVANKAALVVENAALMKEIGELTEQNAALEEERDELEEHVERLAEDAEQEEKILEGKLERAHEENRRLEGRIKKQEQDLTSELGDAYAERAKFKGRYEQSRDYSRKLFGELSRARDAMSELRKQRKELQDYTDRQEDISERGQRELQAKYEAVQQQLDVVSHEFESYREQAELDMAEQEGRHIVELETRQEQLEVIKTQLKTLHAFLEKTRAVDDSGAVEALQQQIAELQEELELAYKNKGLAIGKLDKALKDLELAKDMVEKAQRQMEVNEEERTKAEAGYEAQIQDMSSELDKKDTEMAVLRLSYESQLRDMSMRLDQSTRDLQNVLEAVSKIKFKVEVTEDGQAINESVDIPGGKMRVGLNLEGLNRLQAHIERLQAELHRNEQRYDMLIKLQEVNEQTGKSEFADNLQAKKEAMVELLDHKACGYEVQIEGFRETMAENRAQLNQARAEIADLRKLLADKEAEIKVYARENSELRSKEQYLTKVGFALMKERERLERMKEDLEFEATLNEEDRGDLNTSRRKIGKSRKVLAREQSELDRKEASLKRRQDGFDQRLAEQEEARFSDTSDRGSVERDEEFGGFGIAPNSPLFTTPLPPALLRDNLMSSVFMTPDHTSSSSNSPVTPRSGTGSSRNSSSSSDAEGDQAEKNEVSTPPVANPESSGGFKRIV